MSFLCEFKDHLFLLRDRYGFSLPPDRLQAILVCAEDFTDVEEVCYRTQSMICSSEEQVQIFQSLFAQRFLDKVPEPLAELRSNVPGRSGSLEPEKTEGQMRSELLDQREKQDADREVLADVQRRCEQLEASQRTIRDQTSKAQSEADRTAGELQQAERAVQAAQGATYADPRADPLKTHLDALRTALQDVSRAAEKAGWQDLSEQATEKILDRLSQPRPFREYKEEAVAARTQLMEEARKLRSSGQVESFPLVLRAADVLQKLTKEIHKSVDAGQKKDLQALEKERTGRRKAAAAARKALEDLEERLEEAEAGCQKERSRAEQIARKIQNAETKCKSLEEILAAIERQRAEAAKRAEGARAAQDTEGHEPQRPRAHQDFLSSIQKVMAPTEVTVLLKTDLQRMSGTEKAKILSYIRAHARQFRQTLRRRAATPQHRKVDVKATIQEARKTNGEPLVIRYRAPRKSHARVLMLADISGSCAEAATLALYFMAMMEEAFPGGCKKFAFVNDLRPVDQYFRDSSPDEGVQKVFDNIPTWGVWSDHGTTIHQFREELTGDFRKDTTVIILSDARNNHKPDHAKDLRYIADRCHAVYWLNTDDESQWNKGDSIIARYAAAGAAVYHVQTAGDLLDFLSRMSLPQAQ